MFVVCDSPPTEVLYHRNDILSSFNGDPNDPRNTEDRSDGGYRFVHRSKVISTRIVVVAKKMNSRDNSLTALARSGFVQDILKAVSVSVPRQFMVGVWIKV